MKKIFCIVIIVLICMSCGDSFSEYVYCIENRTEYDVVLFTKEQDSILCLPNKEIVLFQGEFWSSKNLNYTPPLIIEYITSITIVIDGNRKHLIKDFSDMNNWEYTGDEEWSLIMCGSYYSHIKRTFIITENDLE